MLSGLQPTTNQLPACTFVPGATFVKPFSVATVAIPNGACAEFHAVFRVDHCATIGKSITVGLQGPAGVGVVHNVTQTITVVSEKGTQ